MQNTLFTGWVCIHAVAHRKQIGEFFYELCNIEIVTNFTAQNVCKYRSRPACCDSFLPHVALFLTHFRVVV